MNEKLASEQINDIIKQYGGWKGQTLAQIRAIITQADPDILEEVKWKMKTRPEGLPVWSHNGIVCFVETWKDDIKLLFSKGAKLKDSHGLFNARLQSKDLRAIEFHGDTTIDAAKLNDLVKEAIEFNKQK